jgi:hypothetical protein
MSRKCKEVDHVSLEQAAEVIHATADAPELCHALTVPLPYDFGMGLERIAVIIGKSFATTKRLRKEFTYAFAAASPMMGY